MKNEVRPIDANATIEALRANFQQGSWYGCEEPCYQIAEDTIAEMPTLTDHFPNLKKMIQLTQEQLRKMDDQPVRVKNLKYAESRLNTGVVAMYDPNDSDNGVYVGCAFFCIKDYGKDWVAYAYPPAHIDREAWEPCQRCGSKCLTCAVNETRKCTSCKGGSNYLPLYKFCPKCGRPLTEEAWAELEKRMGVRV